MTFKEFKKIMKKEFDMDYEYIGFINTRYGYKMRGYQQFINGGYTSIGKPILAEQFEGIVDNLRDDDIIWENRLWEQG